MRATGQTVEQLEQGFRLGPWRVSPQTHVLRGEDGREIHVNPKAMRVLVALAMQPGCFVSRESLLATVWAERCVTDDVLTGAICELRRALHDDVLRPCVIETRKGSGYRLISDVTPAEPAGMRLRRSMPLRALATTAVIALTLLAAGSGRQSTVARPTIAVLPFANFSGDGRGTYLAGAMTDALILELARRHGLRVISRTSILPYERPTRPLPAIASELGADYLVEGAIQVAGERVRVTAQLIDGPGDVHLWASQFERPFTDVLKIQSELAESISAQVAGVVGPAPSSPGPELSSDALDSLLRARYLLAREEPDLAQQALGLFETLRAAHPDLADAELGVAEAQLYLFKKYRLPHTVLASAERSARRAIELEPRRSEGWRCLGQIRLFRDWDFNGAAAHYRYAIRLNPNDTVARRRHAWLLVAEKRFDEAGAEIEVMRRLDPHYYASAEGALLLTYAGQYDAAIAELQRLREIAPESPAVLLTLARAYWGAGQHDASAAALAAGHQAAGTGGGNLEQVLAAQGRRGLYRHLLANESAGSPVARAALFAQLGDLDATLDWLERGIDAHDDAALYVASRPEFRGLRGDPRFEELVRRIRGAP